ncbi:MAG: zinc ribbon domain-containing protein, partial [Dehalococcoidia bacterium]|nr:zinc ribbon domain-containing protein [Dehalococcoidia bacterium]
MKCPKCQFDNPDDAQFCNQCASRLELSCPECGKVNPAGSRFCNKCAHDLTALSPTPAPP